MGFAYLLSASQCKTDLFNLLQVRYLKDKTTNGAIDPNFKTMLDNFNSYTDGYAIITSLAWPSSLVEN